MSSNINFLKNRWQLLIPALLVALLTACGGGGGSDTGEVPDPPTGPEEPSDPVWQPIATYDTRLAAIRYDLDANGVEDAAKYFSYDADGRVIQENYLYSGDSTDDADFRYFSLNIRDTQSFTTDYTYFPNGLLAQIRHQLEGGEVIRVRYDWSDQRLVEAVEESIFDASGALQGQSLSVLNHAGPRLQSVIELGRNNAVLSELSYQYDNGDVPTSYTREAAEQGMTTHQLSWTAANQLRTVVSLDAEMSIQTRVVVSYDGQGRLLTGRFSLPSGAANDQYSWAYNYGNRRLPELRTVDLGDDGGVDARIEYEVEAASCQGVVAYLPENVGRDSQAELAPFLPGTGYHFLQGCTD